jgi:hypothetical protein
MTRDNDEIRMTNDSMTSRRDVDSSSFGLWACFVILSFVLCHFSAQLNPRRPWPAIRERKLELTDSYLVSLWYGKPNSYSAISSRRELAKVELP